MLKQTIRKFLFWPIFSFIMGICFLSPATAQTNISQSSFDLNEKIQQLQKWLDSHSDQDIVEALSKLDFNQVVEWFDKESTTKNQIKQLEQQIKASESLLEQKRNDLQEVQTKIDLLKLTPTQIIQIEKYNQSLKQDPHFAEWIIERGTWFEIGKDLLISLFFLGVGIFIEAKREEKGQNALNSKRKGSKRK